MDLTLGMILEDACPAGSDENGHDVYYIESHCITYVVYATRIEEGKFQIHRFTKMVS